MDVKEAAVGDDAMRGNITSPDVYHKPNPIFPKGFKLSIRKAIRKKPVNQAKSDFDGEN